MDIERSPTSIDAPAGIQFVGSALDLDTSDYQLLVPVFTDTTGNPNRIVVVGIESTTTVSVMGYTRFGNTWVHDPATDALDEEVTLNFTAAAQGNITAFGIVNPASTGNTVLFIAGNNDATPDTFEMDSIVLGTGGLSATAVVVAGTNQPTDTNTMSTVGIPLSITRVMTFFEDDAHFADVTESGGTYTFTYDDAKVLAVDTSILITGNVGRQCSGIVIGAQVVLMRDSGNVTLCQMWEMSTAAVLTEEFNPIVVGGMGGDAVQSSSGFTAIVGIGGNFAVATASLGWGNATGDNATYVMVTFPLDDI